MPNRRRKNPLPPQRRIKVDLDEITGTSSTVGPQLEEEDYGPNIDPSVYTDAPPSRRQSARRTQWSVEYIASIIGIIMLCGTIIAYAVSLAWNVDTIKAVSKDIRGKIDNLETGLSRQGSVLTEISNSLHRVEGDQRRIFDKTDSQSINTK